MTTPAKNRRSGMKPAGVAAGVTLALFEIAEFWMGRSPRARQNEWVAPSCAKSAN